MLWLQKVTGFILIGMRYGINFEIRSDPIGMTIEEDWLNASYKEIAQQCGERFTCFMIQNGES
jgi:hypothetical protein